MTTLREAAQELHSHQQAGDSLEIVRYHMPLQVDLALTWTDDGKVLIPFSHMNGTDAYAFLEDKFDSVEEAIAYLELDTSDPEWEIEGED